MKIVSVDIMKLKTEGAGPVRPIICRVNTDQGIYGIGEAGVAIVTGATAAYELLKDYARVILGMNPLHHEVIWEKLYKDTFWAQGNGPIIMAAISAIDTALWDIKGKYYGAPVYELLGGKQWDRLWTYASQLQFGWGREAYDRSGALKKYEDACKAAIDQGYTAVKVNFFEQRKTGPNVNYLDATGHLSAEIMNTAEERIALVRSLLGKDGEVLNVAMMAPMQEVYLETSHRNVMSVDIPVFEYKTRTSDANNIYSYGYAFTSSDLDDAVKSLADILPDMLRLAECEKSCQLMAAEIEKTRRRVNALEHVMIPETQENIKYITMKLDESERSTQIRLMKVKDMLLEQAHHYKERQEKTPA